MERFRDQGRATLKRARGVAFACILFALAFSDTARGFDLLPWWGALIVAAACLGGFGAYLRGGRAPFISSRGPTPALAPGLAFGSPCARAEGSPISSRGVILQSDGAPPPSHDELKAAVPSFYRWGPTPSDDELKAPLAPGLALARPALGLTAPGLAASLFAGAFLTLATRLVGYDWVAHRAPESWEASRKESALSFASDLSQRFSDLSRAAVSAAQALARDPALVEAASNPESRESLGKAFKRLERAALPHPLPEAFSGVTLYDGWFRPLAWGGKNVDLSYVDIPEEALRSRVFIVEQGVFTHLMAFEPLAQGEGRISVEVPLAAHRRVDNRYLSDFDVIREWAEGRNVLTDYIDFREQAPELATLFARSGDRYLGGTGATPVHHFPLRSPGGAILGVVSLAEEQGEGILLARKERTARVAGWALTFSFLPLLGFMARRTFFFVRSSEIRLSEWDSNDQFVGPEIAGDGAPPPSADGLRAAHTRSATHCVSSGARPIGAPRALGLSVPHLVGLIFTLWGLRFVLRLAKVPLGLGTSVEDPSYYASNAFFELFGSPIDFLATSLVTTLTVVALVFPVLTGKMSLRPFEVVGRARGVLLKIVALLLGAGVLFLARELVRDTWANASLPLSRPGLLPPDPPRLAVQAGLLSFFFAFALALAFLFVVSSDTAARARDRLLDRFRRGGLYFRWGLTYLFLAVPTLAFFPLLAYYEEETIRRFMENNIASTVLHQGDSQEYVLREALSSVDRMETDGQLGAPERGELAYRIWAASGLSTSALSAAIEVLRDGVVFSRFALNFPSLEAPLHDVTSRFEPDWTLEEESYPSQPYRPRVLCARRALDPDVLPRGGIQIRLAADWSNLPFITTRDPYIDLFRARGADAPLPFTGRQVSLHVFGPQGNVLFRSSNDLLVLDPEAILAAHLRPRWERRTVAGRAHDCFLFTGKDLVFALSYPAETPTDFVVDLTGWALLTGLVTLALLLAAILARILGWPTGFRARDLWEGVGASFYNKLFVAFVLVALVPIVSLAVLVRGIMMQRLQLNVEQEGMARAQVVERYLHDYLLRERVEANERGVAAVTDEILQWVGSVVEADLDLYSRGDLVATSKRELFASGLLPTRAVPAVYREVVVDRADHSIHWESVGSFRYLVVSVPISLERWREPGIVSIPLASRQREINQEVASLNEMVLLVAVCFSLAAAALAYSLARRMAEPINVLTAATRKVAQGDFDVRLETNSRDEIRALYEGFNQMGNDLKRERERSERASKLEAWAEMARQVAHEVKNPLTPIQLSAEHLRRVYSDPNVDFRSVLKACTDTILQQVRTLRQITLEFSTFASPTPLSRERTDLRRLLEETLAPYRNSPPPGVSVALDLAPGLPELSVDRRLMERTVVNLVDNALHALSGGGRVVVSAVPIEWNGHNGVEVKVADDGVGIDPDVRERVFEPYFSTRAAGSGLGLAIAKKAVEEHGGTISLESETGKGTTVRLRLPGA